MRSTKASRVGWARATTMIPLAALLAGPAPAVCATILGSAQTYAVFGGATVTNAGPTTIKGDIGAYPGGSITGLGSITLEGTVHPADAAAQAAGGDAATAFDELAAMPSTMNLTGENLGTIGRLTPGVYLFDTTAQLTGTLTLDFDGHPNQPFVFQVGTGLTIAAASDVVVENGGPGSAIYWEVGTSATLGVGALFAGNLLADQSITLDTGAAIVCGRAIALNAAVTLDSNTVSNDCAGGGDFATGRSDFGSYGLSGGGVPEPATWAMLLVGLVGQGAMLRAYRRPLSRALSSRSGE